MRVLKFGGSSVYNAERIKLVVEILKNKQKNNEIFAAVFSAFGGITDLLIDMAKLAAKGNVAYLDQLGQYKSRHDEVIENLSLHQNQITDLINNNHEALENILNGIFLVQEASLRTMDFVISFGERNSAAIISAYMNSIGMNTSFLDARKIIETNDDFGAAKVNFATTYSKIIAHFKNSNAIQIVTGFIGSTPNGITTTLGRGGSDYTAAILGAALQADCIEIWTDVDGVLTADPRKVKGAFSIEKMTYAEAMEMSHFGAKVIYPPTIHPAFESKIPLLIKNTFNPNHIGTFISETPSPNDKIVQGISSINNIALLTLIGGGLFGVPGIAGRLFSTLALNKINVILITQGSSESSISFVVQLSDYQSAKSFIEAAFEYEINSGLIDPIKVELDLSIIAVVGENMRYQPGIAGKLFHSLGINGINIVAIAQGSSELNISVVIPSKNEQKALNAIHESFFLSDTKSIHVYIVGTGLIGNTLLTQLLKQRNYLKEKLALNIKIIGLANSRKMGFDLEGIDLENWQSFIDSSPVQNLNSFVQTMKSHNLPNTIFIDNTANSEVAAYYEEILNSSISISTPNKIALSSEYKNYQQLKKVANKRGVQFLYETTVGAGLPVISTLKDLIISGDKILKIEGVLSGSLSYIFNNFNENASFYDILIDAKKLGLTEPDPRLDLNGTDVQRKLVILAREAGLQINMNDIEVHSFLPKSCNDADTIEAFYATAKNENSYFETMKQKAIESKTKLRMVASYEQGKAKVKLEYINEHNPLYHLSGSDNMIVFTTERYNERPLVIKGPGAGAEVTAAGVFAELITLANSI
ncbi:MAG: bifunctional aspartate kinase/homoserine dehydrogenase I [Saprospiraceae bacterium]|nr:bifunctional aspartate kinase/homoserine dehydrogenase I [Saprospiraceae bacterium]